MADGNRNTQLGMSKNYRKINYMLCSPETYNLFGDLTILINKGEITFEEAHAFIKENYDKYTWNHPYKKHPPMYK